MYTYCIRRYKTIYQNIYNLNNILQYYAGDIVLLYAKTVLIFIVVLAFDFNKKNDSSRYT